MFLLDPVEPAEPSVWSDQQDGLDAFPAGEEAQAGTTEPWCQWAASGFKAMHAFLGFVTRFGAHVLLQENIIRAFPLDSFQRRHA